VSAAPTPDGFVTEQVEPDDMTDQDFAHHVVLGGAVGILVMFAFLILGMAVTGLDSDVAPAFAWAAIVGGGFFGGLVTLSLAMARAEKAEKAERAARRAEAARQDEAA
jgi:NADH:ubiquinone oxidoreductase subunit 6 (subunit J)